MSGLALEMAAKAPRTEHPALASKLMDLDLSLQRTMAFIATMDHDDRRRVMTTAEIKDLLDQMADAGVSISPSSGGEILMRRDFFQILEHARLLALLRQTQDHMRVMIRAQGKPNRLRVFILGRRIDSDQHLFASSRGAQRRHYQSARQRVTQFDRGRTFPADAGRYGTSSMAMFLMVQNARRGHTRGVGALAAESWGKLQPGRQRLLPLMMTGGPTPMSQA